MLQEASIMETFPGPLAKVADPTQWRSSISREISHPVRELKENTG